MDKFVDQVLNLKFLKRYRTTTVGAVIALLGLWQGLAQGGKVPGPPLELYLPLNALLIERLAKFAKEHIP